MCGPVLPASRVKVRLINPCMGHQYGTARDFKRNDGYGPAPIFNFTFRTGSRIPSVRLDFDEFIDIGVLLNPTLRLTLIGNRLYVK